MTVQDLVTRAEQFRQTLVNVKAALGPQPFEWYRYDSLANLIHIERLLTGQNRELGSFLQNPSMLDIGCADGELAFFFESLGYEVTAVDYPGTNHNHMAGIHKLKEALNSRVEILAMDVDSQFTLPRDRYGLAIILGAIYHLKNPFYLLEQVSKSARCLLASTRIASRFPGAEGSLREVPGAYLLSPRELNGDASNYWIFTESGVRRLLERTNWDPVEMQSFGDTVISNPVDPDHDERLFCFARSHYALANVELLSGWHDPEGAGWRWTERRFSLRVRTAEGRQDPVLRMQLYVPPSFTGPITLRTGSGPEWTYTEPGYHEAFFPLGNGTELAFELSRAVPGDAADPRERGIIVHRVEVV